MSVGRLALILVLQILLHTCKAGAGEILVDPSNQTVPVNSTANFFCRAWGRNARWYINNTQVETFNQGTYESKGFTFTEKITRSQGQDHEFNLNMTVTASAAINTTNFSCTVYLDQLAVSMPAYLIVMGAPAIPIVSLHVVDATTLRLSWEPPFTWPQYEILRYRVIMENRSNGDILPPVILNQSDTTYTITASAPVQSCAELRFSVTAHSALGASTPAVVAGGFPIAPVLNNTALSHKVLFHSDGTPHVYFKFQLPPVCPFQEFSYTITFQRVDTPDSTPIVSGPRIVPPYADERSAPIEVRVSRGLVNGARYSVIVNVNTSAEMSTSVGMSTSSAEFFFDTNIRVPSTTEATLTTELTATTTTALTEDFPLLLMIVIPLAVGLLILTVAVILALAVVIHLRNRNMYRSRSASKDMSHPPMVPNPIYEGPVYETIDTQFHSLTPHRDTPHFPPIESNLDNKFTVLNTEAMQPLNGDVTATVPAVTFPSSVRSEDNYTVMCSARATAAPVQPANNDNNTIRYVQDPSGR